MIQIALVAFLKGEINSEYFAMSILVYADSNQYRAGDDLMVDSGKKVERIGKDILVIILQLFLLPALDLGIQLLDDSADRGLGIEKIRGQLTDNLFHPVGGDTLFDHLADGSKECLFTSLVVFKELGLKRKLPDLGFGQQESAYPRVKRPGLIAIPIGLSFGVIPLVG